MKKMKNPIAPNEASLLRWIATLVTSFLLATLFAIPLQVLVLFLPDLSQSTVAGIPADALMDICSFIPFFLGIVAALKWVAKTSLKDFVLGVGGRVNKKECALLLGLYALGILLSCLISIGSTSLRGVEAGTFATLLLLMLLLTWMQTTWEELLFRGLVLRWACKNKIGFTPKAILLGLLSSVAFGFAHLANPEISSMTGGELVLGLICYILPGLMLYVTDMYFGSLLPGIIIHWLNNFIAFTVITSEVSALPTPTLLVDNSQQTAIAMFISTVLAYLPVTVYMIIDSRKRRKAAV